MLGSEYYGWVRVGKEGTTGAEGRGNRLWGAEKTVFWLGWLAGYDEMVLGRYRCTKNLVLIRQGWMSRFGAEGEKGDEVGLSIHGKRDTRPNKAMQIIIIVCMWLSMYLQVGWGWGYRGKVKHGVNNNINNSTREKESSDARGTRGRRRSLKRDWRDRRGAEEDEEEPRRLPHPRRSPHRRHHPHRRGRPTAPPVRPPHSSCTPMDRICRLDDDPTLAAESWCCSSTWTERDYRSRSIILHDYIMIPIKLLWLWVLKGLRSHYFDWFFVTE